MPQDPKILKALTSPATGDAALDTFLQGAAKLQSETPSPLHAACGLTMCLLVLLERMAPPLKSPNVQQLESVLRRVNREMMAALNL